MNVKLIQIDGKLPNLALMKISAWHKQLGDTVGFDVNDPDKVYISCIFEWNRPLALGIAKMFDCPVEIGGYGVNTKKLPKEIEHVMPDYALYNIDYSVGYLTRGCIRKCPFCKVWKTEGHIQENTELEEFLHPNHRKVIIMDNNLLASERSLYHLSKLKTQNKLKVCFTQGLDLRLVDKEVADTLTDIDYRSLNFKRKRLYVAWDNLEDEKEIEQGIQILKNAGIKPQHLMCYMLTCFDTSFEEDMYRFKKLREWGVDPFVMRYNRRGDKKDIEFARWVNRRVYKSISFEKWLKTLGGNKRDDTQM